MKRLLILLIASFSVHLAVPSATARVADPFFFVQISDPQLGFTASNETLEPDVQLLKTAISHINNLHPAFVIVTGDVVNSYKNEQQWETYLSLISTIDNSIPVYHIPGNHDTGKVDADHTGRIQKYNERMGSDHFSFSYGNCLFVGIDSNVIKDGNDVLESQQYEWLSKQLGKKSRMKFVFSHCPVFRKDFEEKEDYSNFPMAEREKYWSLFQKTGVNAVGAGHVHYDRVSGHKDIDMISTGPVTRPLGKGVSGMAIWVVNPSDCTYHYEYYPMDKVPQTININ